MSSTQPTLEAVENPESKLERLICTKGEKFRNYFYARFSQILRYLVMTEKEDSPKCPGGLAPHSAGKNITNSIVYILNLIFSRIEYQKSERKERSPPIESF